MTQLLFSTKFALLLPFITPTTRGNESDEQDSDLGLSHWTNGLEFVVDGGVPGGMHHPQKQWGEAEYPLYHD